MPGRVVSFAGLVEFRLSLQRKLEAVDRPDCRSGSTASLTYKYPEAAVSEPPQALSQELSLRCRFEFGLLLMFTVAPFCVFASSYARCWSLGPNNSLRQLANAGGEL